MKVVAINGSPRRFGNTHTALQIAGAELEAAGIQTEILQIGSAEIRGCMGCNSCREGGECVFADDAFREMVEKMYQADGVLIGSPVYYAGISGTLKCFLDRAFYQSGGCMRLKVGAAILALRRSGGVPAFDQINNYFLNAEMVVAPSFYWNVIHGQGKGEALKDTEGMSVLSNLGRNMAWLLRIKEETKELIPPPKPVKRERMNFIR